MTGHLSEEELIGYQLGEVADSAIVAEHLEQCALCSDAAESIAETLRVFSADPVPEANLEHAWHRLRGSLPPLPSNFGNPAKRRLFAGWRLPLLWTAGAVLAAGVFGFGVVQLRHAPEAGVLSSSTATSGMRAGPLTARPRDPDVAAHLGEAERLLTEIDHAAGPLDESTRERAAQLLLTNAVYVQRAQRDGDMAQASVLEELGRTLTTVEHEPARPSKRWDLHMEMNSGGLLLDLRILQQNDAEPNRKVSQ